MGLILYLFGVGLFLWATTQSILWLRHRHIRAQAALIAYTGCEAEARDERYAKDDLFDAISVKLVEQAHLWARRGYRIASELQASGAIDETAYARMDDMFERCTAEKERWHVMPGRLHGIAIKADTERRREAKAAWQELERDRRLLRHHATHTYWIAYNDPETIG